MGEKARLPGYLFSKLGYALFGPPEIPRPRKLAWLEIPAGHGVKGRREDGD